MDNNTKNRKEIKNMETNMVEAPERKLYFSLFSGQIYTVDKEDAKNLDEGQIPLLDYPKANCRKCFGRGYTDKNVTTGFYSVCKCMKTRINFNEFDRLKKI